MSATVREIADDALGLIGDMPGVSVQTYGEDRMLAEIGRGFDLIFKKYFWDQYTDWFRVELDGVLGIPTTDAFEYVRDFEDFSAVFPDAQNEPLAKKASRRNPYAMTNSGTTPLNWGSLPVTSDYYVKRKLKFYPATATGFVNVYARVHPLKADEGWDWADVMHLDKSMLVYGASFMAFIKDELNPGAADTCKNLMEMRFRDIINSLGSHDLSIEDNSGIPTQWSEV